MPGLTSIISGLIGGGQSLPTVDIAPLLSTISNSGTYQKQLINGLPDNVQKLLAQYMNSNNAAGGAYQSGITGVGNDLMSKISSLYGPNSDAANAQKTADKTAIYSTVPGTQDAIRNAMAATGGLGRGNAGVALAQPYVNAAQQNGQAAAGVDAQQTKAGQDASASAMKTVASMDDSMFTNLFGMSKAQATQILSSGNMALTTQLADLINQNSQQTSATLGAQGVAANNAYQNAVTRNAQQNQVWNGVADLGLSGIQAGLGAFGGGGGGAGDIAGLI